MLASIRLLFLLILLIEIKPDDLCISDAGRSAIVSYQSIYKLNYMTMQRHNAKTLNMRECNQLAIHSSKHGSRAIQQRA